MTKYKFILSTAFTLLSLFIVFPVFAIEYGGLGGRPAFPREDNSRSDSIFIHEILPQQTINEGIKVINNTSETKTLLVYSTDETPSTDGGFACKQLSEQKIGVGDWISLEKSEVTLDTVSSEVIPFTITAPDSVDVGEHNGCIVIQEKKEKTGEAGLKLSFRTGIRVALTVPGKIIRLVDIVAFRVIDKNADIYVVSPTIKNSGNVSIDTDVKVIVENVFSKKVTEFGGTYAVLRNNPLVLNFDFAKPLWGGKYVAKTIVTYNDGTNDKVLESREIEFISWPKRPAQIYISSTILLVFLLVLLILFLRKKRAKKIGSWQYYTFKEGDTLSQIVKNRNVSWKEVIKVNKLKPPYEIKIGEKIKVPPTK